MHSGDMIEIDDSNLTEEEKEKLKVVMEKARVRSYRPRSFSPWKQTRPGYSVLCTAELASILVVIVISVDHITIVKWFRLLSGCMFPPSAI